MFVTIGRQPIYSRDFVVSSYEFLYRSNAGVSAAAFGDEDAATRTVVSNAINLFGLSELTDGAIDKSGVYGEAGSDYSGSAGRDVGG